MTKNSTVEQVESVMRKITWAQEILTSIQANTDAQTADIISGVTFIMNSASEDAEGVYSSLR